jgi:hypothetical protein
MCPPDSQKVGILVGHTQHLSSRVYNTYTGGKLENERCKAENGDISLTRNRITHEPIRD